MKLKQLALRGLITLAVVVALCMFFSGTIKTITTPKVKIVTTKEGKLEQTADLTAKLTFPKTEPFRIEAAMDATVLVERVFVRAGYEVKEGDLIFTATMTDFDEQMGKLKTEYEEKMTKIEDLDRKNSERTRTTTRTTQFKEILSAQDALHEAEIALQVAMRNQGITLDLTVSEGEDELTCLTARAQAQEANQTVLDAIRTRYDARLRVEAAQTAFAESGKDWKLAVTDETWAYIIERDELLEEIAALDEQMVELELLRLELAEVRAPRDGYITDIAVKAGENYDGKAAAYEMNEADVMPVLRASVDGLSVVVQEGTTANVQTGYYDVEATVASVGYDENGKKYADIALTDELIRAKGGVYNMTLSDISTEISVRADRVTTLIPASAVRSEGEDDNYVYVIQTQYGSFTGDSMYVVKTPVEVIARSDKLVSVSDDLYGVQLADKEDRAIGDGATVMEYVD